MHGFVEVGTCRNDPCGQYGGREEDGYCSEECRREATRVFAALPGADRQPRQPRAMAQHYLGWGLEAAERISVQSAGAGAAIVRYVQARGIGFVVSATWPGTRALERQLKNRKHASRFCPVCRQQRRG
jgi:hypothetical protein